MASNRWVAIDPDILIHPLVGAGQAVAPADPSRGAYSRMEAWLWIICNASFADHTVMNRGRKMTLHRGDLLGAWAFLAHTFNWSSKVVRAWVEKLIEDNMLQRRAIEAQTESSTNEEMLYGNQATILNIVNYWRFQFDEMDEKEGSNCTDNKGKQKGKQLGKQFDPLSVGEIADKYVLQQQQGQAVGQAKGQHITKDSNYPYTSNNYCLSETSSDDKKVADAKPKKAKRERKPVSYPEEFEIFWTAYPDRTNNSKPNAGAEWALMSEPDRNAALASMPAFRSFCQRDPTYRCIHAERYLRGRRWETHGQANSAKATHLVWWKDPAQIQKLTLDRWRDGIAKHANGIWPVDKLGPPPGHRECIVPAVLIDELQLTQRYNDKGIAKS